MKTNILDSKLRGLYYDDTQYLNCRSKFEEISQLRCWFGGMNKLRIYYLASIHNISKILEQEIYSYDN